MKKFSFNFLKENNMVAIFSGSRWMSAKPAGMDWLMKMAKLYNCLLYTSDAADDC